MNPNLVNKALSQEEQTILANIKSLTEELMSANASTGMDAGSPAGDGAEKADLGMTGVLGQQGQEPDGDEDKLNKSKNENIDDMDDKGQKVKLEKDITATPSDGETASSDAEQRMDEVLTGLTEENVESVAKAIARIQKTRQVNKSASSPIVSAINELARVVKDISSRQMEQETAFGNLLDGLGVTKQIETAMGADRVEKSRTPIFANDNSRLAKSLADVMTLMKGQTVEKTERVGDSANTVRKNMETAVSSLIPRK